MSIKTWIFVPLASLPAFIFATISLTFATCSNCLCRDALGKTSPSLIFPLLPTMQEFKSLRRFYLGLLLRNLRSIVIRGKVTIRGLAPSKACRHYDVPWLILQEPFMALPMRIATHKPTLREGVMRPGGSGSVAETILVHQLVGIVKLLL